MKRRLDFINILIGDRKKTTVFKVFCGPGGFNIPVVLLIIFCG